MLASRYYTHATRLTRGEQTLRKETIMLHHAPDQADDLNISWKDILIDSDQGTTQSGRAFGFTLIPGEHDYCGLFFTWPREQVGIRSVAEREAVLDSLEYDETTQYEPHVPMAVARKALDNYLRKTYDLRRKQD
jgi:hypothetical protein